MNRGMTSLQKYRAGINFQVKYATQYLTFLNAHVDQLDEWEKEFVESINARRFHLHQLSAKQYNKLKNIYDDVGRRIGGGYR
jgi:hypothetical protein